MDTHSTTDRTVDMTSWGNVSSEAELDPNKEMNDWVSPTRFHLAWFVPISAVLWSVSVFGNASVLICVVRDKKLHRPSYYLVAALSLADIGFPLFGFPAMTYGAFVRVFGTTCKPRLQLFILLPNNIVNITSFLTLVCLQVERYISLAFPLFHRRVVTKRRALVVVASLWIFSSSSTALLYHFSLSTTPASSLCPMFPYEFGVMVSTFGFCGSLVLLFVNCHFLILLRRHLRNRAMARKSVCLQQIATLPDTTNLNNSGGQSNGDHGSVNQGNGNNGNGNHGSVNHGNGDNGNGNHGYDGIGTQASTSVGIIVILFILCWLPLTTLATLETIGHRREMDRALLDVAMKIIILLFLLNGAINPVVYARKNPHLRVAFRKLVGKNSNRIGEA